MKYTSEYRSLQESKYTSKFKEKTIDEPRIYVADLAAYNSGKHVGEWLDLSDYSSGREVMKKIGDLLKKWSKKAKEVHEEYAIHDYEGFPKSSYSEYMGEEDFQNIIDAYEIAKDKGLPYDILLKATDELKGNKFSVGDMEEVAEELYFGEYEDEEAFAEYLVDEGLISDDLIEANMKLQPGDIRILAGEEADNYAENLDESDLNEDETIEEARDEHYKNVKKELEKDALDYYIGTLGYDRDTLIEDTKDGRGLFIIDYKDLAYDLDQSGDFNYIEDHGKLYVFRNQ